MGGGVPMAGIGSMLMPLDTEVGCRVIVRHLLGASLVAVREKPSLYRVVGVLESELLAETLADVLLGTDVGGLR
jgi:hypothetical protein